MNNLINNEDAITTRDKLRIEIAKKKLEYKNNPIKFIEECIYIPDAGGDTLFKLYAPQKELLNTFYKNNFVIVLKTRQTGVSTLFQAISCHLLTFYKNVRIGIVSKSGAESSDFCRKTIDMLDKIDKPWLKPSYKTKSALSFSLKNGGWFYTQAVSLANPGALFRGKTIHVLIIDEAAHIQKIDEGWTSVAPTLSKAHTIAKKNNVPYGCVIISTPNKMDGIGKWYYQRWVESESGNSTFLPFVLHWKQIDEFSNDPNWYKSQCAILGNDSRKIRQELDMEFIGADNTFFPDNVQMTLQDISKHRDPISETVLTGGYKAKFYKMFDIRNFYLIGVDTASEGGSDFSAIQVVEYKTLEQIAQFHGKLAVKDFVNVIKYFATVFPNNILIIEKTGGYGNQIIEELTINPENEQLYDLYGEYSKINDQSTFKAGLNTTTKTRPMIIDALYHVVCEDINRIHSIELSREICGLVYKGKRVEADIGYHDDLVLAYAFCCYVKMYGRKYLGDVESRESGNSIGGTLELEHIPVLDFNFNKRPLRHIYQNSENIQDFNKSLSSFLENGIKNGDFKGFIDIRTLF